MGGAPLLGQDVRHHQGGAQAAGIVVQHLPALGARLFVAALLPEGLRQPDAHVDPRRVAGQRGAQFAFGQVGPAVGKIAETQGGRVAGEHGDRIGEGFADAGVTGLDAGGASDECMALVEIALRFGEARADQQGVDVQQVGAQHRRRVGGGAVFIAKLQQRLRPQGPRLQMFGESAQQVIDQMQAAGRFAGRQRRVGVRQDLSRQHWWRLPTRAPGPDTIR